MSKLLSFGHHHTIRERGQSLVEFSLFLALVFIPMLAGLVEVSQYMVTQNRISTAARAAARFGANGGQDEGMVIVAQSTVSQTVRMNLSPDVWDIWSIRGRIDNTGTDFDIFTFEHIFGSRLTARFGDVVTDTVKAEVLANLKAENRDVRGLRIVGTLILYDTESIVGINNFWDKPYSIRSLNVLRLTGLNLEQTNGCAAFPIAIRSDATSALAIPGGGYLYPVGRIPSSGDFPLHQPGKTLDQSREGDVYVFNEGQFNWLAWNQFRTLPEHIIQSLAWPGNSLDYSDPVPSQRGYIEPTDPADNSLHVGDFVATAAVTLGSVQNALNPHIDLGRTLRVIVWDDTGTQIGGFAVFRLHGYGSNWIMAEFIRLDTSCGQVIPEGSN